MRTSFVVPGVRSRRSRGFAMLEALVGILIFSIGILGLVGVQAAMTKAQTSAKYRADAAYLASDLVGTMWADSVNLAKYGSTSGCAAHATCKAWTDKVAAMMPGGVTPSITVDSATSRVDITITWTLPEEGSHSFKTSTAINPNS